MESYVSRFSPNIFENIERIDILDIGIWYIFEIYFVVDIFKV